MSPLLEILATLAAGLFTGAALYVTAVEHPARVSCGSVLAVTEFRPSYERGAVMQTALAPPATTSAMPAPRVGASAALSADPVPRRSWRTRPDQDG